VARWFRLGLSVSGPFVPQKSISLLPPGQKAAVEGFLNSEPLLESIEADLVQGIQPAWSGLIAMPVIPAAMLATLPASGAPGTFEQRFTSSRLYRRWDLNPQPLAGTGF